MKKGEISSQAAGRARLPISKSQTTLRKKMQPYRSRKTLKMTKKGKEFLLNKI